MPDVTRSDSQRSDTSLRPRVSFNRDVHVKRIVPREAARSALVTSDEGHFGSLVRKERLPKNKDQLKKEAAKVINQVDKIDRKSKNKGAHPEKFNTLPARKKYQANPEYPEQRSGRRNSIELTLTPPKKPPRTFATSTPKANKEQRSSIFSIFRDKEKEVKPKKSNLRRSVSDATNLKSKKPNDGNDNAKQNKKQLSPIIEVTQREDYFTPTNLKPSTSFKENDKNVDNEIRKGKSSVTEQLKEFIDEIDSALLNETNKNPPVKEKERKKAEVVIIDVDKAEKISSKNKSKLNASIGKKLKSITTKKGKKTKEAKKEEPVSKIKETIENLENQAIKSPEMIHSSQQPVEKLPLTRGRAVDTMVKRLSHEGNSPPPKTNIMVAPNVTVQHNNNQPFSYTRALSPDPISPTNPIIYAQVVCGSNGSGTKQTVHTTYTNGKKHLPHSDSDEGLGYEENSGFRNNSEKSITHFGDGKYNYHDEEYPITPNFKSNFNGFTSYSKMDQGIFIDSSSRGRGDGMDSKRRESLTEPDGMNGKFNGSSSNLNGRKDLSARRDLLESRINRRFGPVNSPEYSPKANVYVTETSSRYYRSGSASPIGVREKVVSEIKTDRRGNQYTTNVHTKKYLGDERDEYRYSYDNEPKSFDSQVSDYRSSPENPNKHFETSHRTSHHSKYMSKQQLSKDRDFHKSNPEITQRQYNNYDTHMRLDDSYHDSLDRDANGKQHKERSYFDHSESERKDKFGDSGIENDFRRDSGERRQKRREFSNESEDEGFASSLLIASERQHTEDNFARKNRRSYEYNREDEYRNSENSGEYRSYRNKHEYVPRERSIDDGSHFDPRIDKNVEKERSTLRKVEKKPPKPEKKSSLEKMKQLFSSSKKKKDKPGMVREESLRARYQEYKGNQLVDPKMFKKEVTEANAGYDYNSSRRRLSTPSPSPTRELPRNGKNDATHGSWFKSLDRLSRKKTKKDEKEGNVTSTEDEVSKPTKSLRFFGDTDIESSNDSIRHKSVLKSRSGLSHRDRTRSQSSRDLHNISEESHKSSHKSMLNIPAESDRDVKGSRLSLKPPASPSHRNRELSRSREDRSRRRKNEVSSVESSTEGDSSQQSQRSVVYLHAATVGDIPGPGYLRNGRRAASREELTSNTSSRIQPQVKTLSRSFSVLAPWKPKHYKEGVDIDYTQYPSKPVKNGKYEQNKNGSSRKEATSTLKKKAQETRRSNQNVSTLNRKSKSKENVSTLKRTSESKGSSSSLYKKRERQPKENNRYSRDDKKIAAAASKSMSVESLGSNKSGRKGEREVSRSISMPRDPEKSAGWFTMTKKSKKSGSTQRL